MTRRKPHALIVHLGGIGDFILACPALAKLAQTCEITLIGRKDRLELGVKAGIAKSAHDWESVGFDTLFNTPSERIRAFVKKFDRAVIWMRDVENVARNLRSLGITQVDGFPGLPPEDWMAHASTYYAKCLGFDEVDMPNWSIPAAHDPKLVLVHPGSGSPKKNWPRDQFQRLCEQLREWNLSPEIILGPAESDFHGIVDFPVLRPPSLNDLAERLASARLYVGNDSGITHLAAAVGCPTVAIFGPTNPNIWGPRGCHVIIVQHTPWPALSDVLRCCRQNLAVVERVRLPNFLHKQTKGMR